jgi:hypothetical protein
MKLLIFIFFLNFTQVFGQANPYNKIPTVSDIIDKNDSFEVRYERYKCLKQIVDTFPLFTDDENDGWRLAQLVRYYLDNDSVIIISFRDGKRGDCYFFFEGPYLRKVRTGHSLTAKTKSYYYTVGENNGPIAQIKVFFKNGLLRNDKASLLAAGQALKAKYHNLH